ncbi:hypothetical protein [Candidatus Poriferisodalis sp.]|uniref:hypothetical protein n=1 Tax=Candidatus Poriferisodalis sp. TaxID=3101277 RepID=UPI003B527E61
MSELDEPEDPSDIWYACPPDEVPAYRMLMQGDVVVLDSGPVCVVSHACSMRRGVGLHPTQIVAPVLERTNTLWRGDYDWMPLPELAMAEVRAVAASLRELSSVATADLETGRRVASMSEVGIQLLQQRMAHHLTRVSIELTTLAEHSAPVLMEVNLHEEWVEALGEDSEPDFHAFLDADDRRLRKLMLEPQTRFNAQSVVRQEIKRRRRAPRRERLAGEDATARDGG